MWLLATSNQSGLFQYRVCGYCTQKFVCDIGSNFTLITDGREGGLSHPSPPSYRSTYHLAMVKSLNFKFRARHFDTFLQLLHLDRIREDRISARVYFNLFYRQGILFLQRCIPVPKCIFLQRYNSCKCIFLQRYVCTKVYFNLFFCILLQ